MPSIRKATSNDALQLMQIAEQTFRDTFAATNTAEDMELHCQQTYSVALQAGEISDPNRVTLLVEEREELIGYAQVRWAGVPSCVPGNAPGEIQRLYVAKAWHGQGVAHLLMQACLDEIQQRGADVVWLGVWERNPRALAFYRKLGFVEIGDHCFELGRDPQRDIIMVRRLADPDVRTNR